MFPAYLLLILKTDNAKLITQDNIPYTSNIYLKIMIMHAGIIINYTSINFMVTYFNLKLDLYINNVILQRQYF